MNDKSSWKAVTTLCFANSQKKKKNQTCKTTIEFLEYSNKNNFKHRFQFCENKVKYLFKTYEDTHETVVIILQTQSKQ